jgi:hypothetical protein
MNKIKDLKISLPIVTVILFGLGIRFLVVSRGHNYDFDSFIIVAQYVDRGINVYASTTRYNYGPIWFHILYIMFQIASKNVVIFRYILVAFLSLIDLSIFAILYRKLSRTVAILFFLNPISIIITGYQNQFDNLALLIGMLSVLIIGDNYENPITKRKILGLFILGLSITTKHLLFAFPFWLAIKQKGIFQKILTILIPVLVFIISFVPYWHDGHAGIINNVLLYRNFNYEYFYRFFIPPFIQMIFSSLMVWIILLVVFAIVFRQRKGFESLLLYTCILVATSPLISNQYLAIVVPFVSAYLNPFTLSYTLIGTLLLLFDPYGLHFNIAQNATNFTYSPFIYFLLIVLLCLGLIRSIWSQQLIAFIKKVYIELKIQFGNDN